MANFDPFGKLAEVERYKTQMNMKAQAINEQRRQNVLARYQQKRANRIQDNALAQAQADRERMQRGREFIGRWEGEKPITPQDIYIGGFPDVAEEYGKVSKQDKPDTPYSTPIKTSKGWMRFNNRTGMAEPMEYVGGEPALPIPADPKLKGRMTTATKEAERVAKLKSSKPKAYSSLQSFKRGSKNVLDTIAEAKKLISFHTTGTIGMAERKIPGSPAYNLQEKLKTIVANKAFGFLSEMRQNSPTGGAVGQLSERELELMGLVEASTNQGVSDKELFSNLSRIEQLTKEMEISAEEAFNRDFAEVMEKKRPAEPPMATMHKSTKQPMKVGRFIIEEE